MKESRRAARSATTPILYLTLSLMLLLLAGCSGSNAEDPAEDGLTPEAETPAALSQAPQTAVEPQGVTQAPPVPVQQQPAQTQTPADSQTPPAIAAAPPEVDSTPSGLASSVAPVDQTAGVADVAPPATVRVPEGSVVSVLLIDPLSSGENQPGDQFLASLAEPIVVGDQIVVDEGVTVRGRVVETQQSGRVRGRASIQLVLTHILPVGDPIAISTRPFSEEAESDLGRDATLGGIGAAAGAAIGAIAGGGRGAAIGAAAGGAGTVAATRGREVEYPAETRLVFELDRSVELPRISQPLTSRGEPLGF